MPALLALDLGTTTAKAALISLDGRTLGAARADYPLRRTPDGGAEQDPADWVRAARTAIAALLGAGAPVAALCLTGQMQDLVLEGPGGAVRPAVLYTDCRAAVEAHAIRAELARGGADWDAIAGNLQDATSCAAMFRRLARVEPETLARVRGIVLGPAGHLAHLLGAGLRCDPTTAATTGLLDARTRTWSAEVAGAAGIDPALLPELTAGPGEVIGRTDAGARELLGLPAGVPIVLAPGDAGAAALGITGPAPGQDHVSLGTSGWIASIRGGGGASADGGGGVDAVPLDTPAGLAARPLAPAADPASHRLALSAGTDLQISAILAAGAAAAWARDAYLGGADAAAADRLLRGRGRGPTGLLVIPSLGGERFPVRDDSLRGAVLGIDATTAPADLYAATLEGVALALSHALDASGRGRVLPVVGGGAASEPWRRILADVTGRPVLRADGADATLLGAALAGADALGLAHGITPLADQGGDVTAPDPRAAEAYDEVRPVHRRLYDLIATIPTPLPTPHP